MELVLTSPDDLRSIVASAIAEGTAKLAANLPSQEPPKEWLTETEARAYLGWSRATMQRRRDDGTLPYSKVGQSIFYRRGDLCRVLEAHMVTEAA